MRALRINSRIDSSGREVTPQAQARPRLGRFGHTYSPKTPWYALVRWRAAQQAPRPPLDGPLGLRVELIFPRPKAIPATQTYKTSRPDIDNLGKAIMDAMTEAGWWVDDARVADGRTIKRYAVAGEDPGAIISVWKLEDPRP